MRRILLALAAMLVMAAPPCHGQGVTRVCVESIGANGSNNCVDASPNNPFPTSYSSYPTGAIPLTNSASAVATLAAAVAKTTYICGFSVDSNATAATSGTASITNTISGTMNFVQAVAALPAVAQLSRTFTPCIPASAQNMSISVGAATGAGGGATTVNAWGFQQ